MAEDDGDDVDDAKNLRRSLVRSSNACAYVYACVCASSCSSSSCVSCAPPNGDADVAPPRVGVGRECLWVEIPSKRGPKMRARQT